MLQNSQHGLWYIRSKKFVNMCPSFPQVATREFVNKFLQNLV